MCNQCAHIGVIWHWPHELLLASALVENNEIMITYREITIIFEFHWKILKLSFKKDGDTYGDIHVWTYAQTCQNTYVIIL